MDLLIKPRELIVLKYLTRNKNPVSFGTLKSYLASEIEQIDSSVEALESQGYLIKNESGVSLIEKGISFINEYDKIGSEYISNEDLDGAIISFLYKLDAPISTRWFPLIIQEKAPITTMSNAIEGYHLHDYITFKSSKSNYILFEKNKFSLKPSGKDYYESKIAEKNKISEDRDSEKNIKKELAAAQLKLTKLQIKEAKRKLFYGIIGFIAGGIITNVKDIWHLMKIVFHI
jgi:hypothetical protein